VTVTAKDLAFSPVEQVTVRPADEAFSLVFDATQDRSRRHTWRIYTGLDGLDQGLRRRDLRRSRQRRRNLVRHSPPGIVLLPLRRASDIAGHHRPE
jgi:hypothetical protein